MTTIVGVTHGRTLATVYWRLENGRQVLHANLDDVWRLATADEIAEHKAQVDAEAMLEKKLGEKYGKQTRSYSRAQKQNLVRMTTAGVDVGSAVTTLKSKYGMLAGAVAVITQTGDSVWRLDNNRCGKRHFLSHLYIKCIILPRQARDKHRENSKKGRFLQVYQHASFWERLAAGHAAGAGTSNRSAGCCSIDPGD
jgi:hypothetical protein